MTIKTRNLIRDLLWLCFALCITMALLLFFLKWDARSKTFDFHFHDTYLVIHTWHLVIPLFILLSFMIFLIKGAVTGFKSLGSNIYLLTSGLLIIIFFSLATRWLIELGTNFNFTAYPPLSDLEDVRIVQVNPVILSVTYVFSGLQIFITILLVVFVFYWGRNRSVK